MKRNHLLKIILAVLMLITSLATVNAFAAYRDDGKSYEESEYCKIIDNVVYYLNVTNKGKKFYSVIEFGANKSVREKMTKINIVEAIDGIPVTAIDVYDADRVSPRTLYPNVKEITIPDCIETIGDGAFRALANIQEIKLPENLKELGEYAFKELRYLKQITIPEKIKVIPEECFENCTSLKKVTVKGNIERIDPGAFGFCKNLESISSFYSLNRIGEEVFFGCQKLKSFYFPETLTEIGRGAFYNTGLTSVVIPSKTSLVGYEEGHFANCKNLKSVIFENRKDTLYVSEMCFDGCTNLETVVLPASAKIVILWRAFRNCTKLTNLVNTGRIDHIYEAAFANCTSLQSIKFSSKIKIIEKKAFQGCKNLTSVTFADKSDIPGNRRNKLNCFDPKTFSGTPAGMKFYVKNATVAKKLKTALKGSGVNNASIYYSASNKLVYKNVK